MLYCLPQSFIDDLTEISEHRKEFIHNFSLASYEISSTIKHIEPVSFLIQMILNQPNLQQNDIISLKTYGTYNALSPSTGDKHCSIFYACKYSNYILIAYPKIRTIIVNSGDVFYTKWDDEYEEKYAYSVQAITKDNTKTSLDAFIEYDEDIFEPSNIKVKIPISLAKKLA